MRVLVVEDNGLLRHHLSVQMREMVTRLTPPKMPKKRITFCRNMRRTLRLSTSACPAKTA
ncbi:DNA-binding transcriptional regulator PhoP [Serratia odorifera]|uniref:DNA-binding transcriptional regulator PhoP n=1 Tax=Serratia odorifera TaxID=618 RepID=A0A447L0E7_SEROD|nr:DNA-binding transcriptional regulator PhoP [Serratia odorifera]